MHTLASPRFMDIVRRRAGVALTALAACSHSGTVASVDATRPEGAAAAPLKMAKVDLQPLMNSGVAGSITFTELAEGGLKVEGTLHGIKASGLHGFHVHDKPDCSAADGASAGGHFNPTQKGHGDPASPEVHIGDLGNVAADANGNAQVSVVKRNASLEGNASFIGHSVILHKLPDDLKSQPAGASGDRIACGVIVGA